MTRTPITPKTLAAEIGIDPKQLRNFLRKEFTRANEVKNTTWIIPPATAKAAKAHFAKQEAKAPDAPIDLDDLHADALVLDVQLTAAKALAV